MGLSASQARLLTLTSRLNDVQYKQQQLANTKMRSSVESEEIAQKYNNALSKQKFQFKNSATGQYQDMTLKAILASGDYKLVRVRDGKKVVTNSNKGYSRYTENPENAVMPKIPNSIGYNGGFEWKQSAADLKFVKVSEKSVMKAFDKAPAADLKFVEVSEKSVMKAFDKKMPADIEWFGGKGEAPVSHIPVYDNEEKVWIVPQGEHGMVCVQGFKYVSMSEWQSILQEARQGLSGDNFTIDDKFANDPNWLYEAVESGEFKLVDKNGNDINTTSSTDIDTVRDDSDEVKAKAEYDAAMNKINRKEKMIDNQMKMLDTTHSAVQQEIESVQNILSRHTEKDFNLFG